MPQGRAAQSSGTSKGFLLDLVRTLSPISRADLALQTGLTSATVSTLVRQLLDEGLVRESGLGRPNRGRPTVLLEVETAARYAVGVQLGVESITYIVADLRGAIVGRVRAPGADAGERAELIPALVGQVEALLTGLGIVRDRVAGIGVAVPGPIDVTRGAPIWPSRLTASGRVSLRDLIAEAAGMPVVFDNEATAAALAGYWAGVTEGSGAHATVYMGLGLGAGILTDGTVYRGSSSNAGEIGQIAIATDRNGRPVAAEEMAAPAAVVRSARKHPEEVERLGLAGDTLTQFTAIAKASARGDAFATSLLEASAHHLATAVTTLATLFDLDSVSLAGPGFAVAGSLYLRVIDSRVNASFFARAQHGVRVRLSPYMQDAAAVGAAALMLQSELAPRNTGRASTQGAAMAQAQEY